MSSPCTELRQIAAQALSSIDQLEAGVRAGHPKLIQEARQLIRGWVLSNDNQLANLTLAVREMLRAAADGEIDDILMALKAVTKLSEAILKSEEV